MDHALFLPRDWTEERECCRQAGIPEGVDHRPKTEMAPEMLLCALDSGVTVRWVTGDAVYGESL